MNTFFAMLNGWEIVLILAVVLVLFGAKKLPELARGMGQGLKEFKKATREVTDELQNAVEEEPRRATERRLPENTVAQVTTPPAPTEPPASSSEPKA